MPHTIVLILALSAPLCCSSRFDPPPAPLQDDGFGACPSFSHLHPLMGTGGPTGGNSHPDPPVTIYLGETPIVMDGLCHRDDNTDAPILDAARPKLPRPAPKPHFHPNPKDRWL